MTRTSAGRPHRSATAFELRDDRTLCSEFAECILTDQCLDIAELRCLDNGLGNWTDTDWSEGPISQKWAAMAKHYHERAECLRQKIVAVYKVDAGLPAIADDGVGGFSDPPSTSGSLAYF